jgi:predicted HTH domain antitoxin
MINTVELTLELPSNLTKDEAQTLLAVKLYETERVSLGQAAKLAGYSKRAFIEILGRQGVPVFNYSPDELREELGL